jgi:hypothetical protein
MSKENSWAPIDVGEEMLRELIAGHNIMPEFWQVILSFRPQTNRLEEAYSDSVWKQQRKDILGG